MKRAASSVRSAEANLNSNDFDHSVADKGVGEEPTPFICERSASFVSKYRIFGRYAIDYESCVMIYFILYIINLLGSENGRQG